MAYDLHARSRNQTRWEHKKANKQARRSCNSMGSFFESLPEDDLCDEEEELLHLLCEIAHLKKSFMPTDVSIQMWAERRLPERYIDLCNSSGLVYVKGDEHIYAAPKESFGRYSPTSVIPRPSTAPLESSDLVKDAQAYFAEMSAELTDDEVTLREELVKILWMGKNLKLNTLAGNQMFLDQFRSVFPEYIEVQDWLEHRLVDDIDAKFIETKKKPGSGGLNNPKTQKKRKCDEDGYERRKHYIIRLKHDGPIKTGKTNEEWEEFRSQILDDWFTALPENDFSPNEDTLRCAILQFLNECPRHVALLGDVCASERIATARAQLLPLYISLVRWVERRLGNDVEILSNNTVLALPGSVGIDEDVDTMLASQKQEEPIESRCNRKHKTFESPEEPEE